VTTLTDRLAAPASLQLARRGLRFRSPLVARFARNRRAVIGLAILLVLAVIALGADVIATYDPEAADMAARYQPPSAAHILGADGFGRDVFSRAVSASRVTLTIAVVSVTIAVGLSIVVGAVAGFYGGLVDNALIRVTEVMLAIPSLLFAITVVGAFGPSVPLLICCWG
jgi:peptide/nickel transport system permease protein